MRSGVRWTDSSQAGCYQQVVRGTVQASANGVGRSPCRCCRRCCCHLLLLLCIWGRHQLQRRRRLLLLARASAVATGSCTKGQGLRRQPDCDGAGLQQRQAAVGEAVEDLPMHQGRCAQCSI